MKSVMISIKPKWCELIAIGKKTIEVRKNKPKLPTPFKCYIYECNCKENTYWNVYHKNTLGKVIGEFVCDKIKVICPDNFIVREDAERALDGSCIPIEEFRKYREYVQGTPLYMLKDAYAWHISNLKIYDKPKELSEFGLTRPPQSWCYVEVVEG